MKRIGIAVVEQRGRILVGIRPRGTVLAGLHEFPGGKCEPDESPSACAVRECQEETGLRVEVSETLLHRQHHYDHGDVDLTFFLCRPLPDASPPQPPFQWVPIVEIEALDFPAANQEVVTMLISRFMDRNSFGNPAG